MPDLLPPNATPLEKRTATALAVVDSIPTMTREYWNPDDCPAELLPYLAAEVSVDGWELAESDEARRALIKGAIQLHQKRGTPWAVREVIRRLGFGEIDLVEGRNVRRRDGTARYSGEWVHGNESGEWAQYIVRLHQAITLDQADNLRAVLERYAPKRSELYRLDYSQAPLRRNRQGRYDGQYTRGNINV